MNERDAQPQADTLGNKTITQEPMDPVVKALWVNALRSGEFRQGRFKLCGQVYRFDGPRYCCLGVLSELAARAGAVRSRDHEDLRYYGDENEGHGLSREVVEWAGLDTHVVSDGDVVFTTPDAYVSLASRNDDGYGFQEIATLIEDNL